MAIKVIGVMLERRLNMHMTVQFAEAITEDELRTIYEHLAAQYPATDEELTRFIAQSNAWRGPTYDDR